MRINSGWIKLYRQLKDVPFYKNSKAVHIWIECLFRANHQESKIFSKRELLTLNVGQFVMGRDEFGACIGLSGSTVWSWIQKFKSNSMIDIKTSNKGTVVTILNWKEYQRYDSDTNNKKTTKKHLQEGEERKEKGNFPKKNSFFNYWEDPSKQSFIRSEWKRLYPEYNPTNSQIQTATEFYFNPKKPFLDAIKKVKEENL